MQHKVLIVDDEPEIREELSAFLCDQGYNCLDADNGNSALEIIRNDPEISIVVSDINMPGQNGLEFLESAQSEATDEFAFILLTGKSQANAAIEALRLGAQDFLLKPIGLKHFLHVIRRCEEMIDLRRARRLHRLSLEAEVKVQTGKIRSLLEDLENAYEDALECMAVAAEFKDPETGTHIRRIGAYAKVMAGALGWTIERQRIIELAAPLHDIGKIGIPDNILLKPGKLDKREIAVMKRHSEIGHRILGRSDSPVMKCAAEIAFRHHERWDGTGYPNRLQKDEISIEARITAFADVYDALRSPRPYKPPFDHDKAVSIIIEGDGRTSPDHFDPKLLECFSRQSDEFEAIYDLLSD